MRIHIDDLHSEVVLPIHGTEPWLARIYADTNVASSQTEPPRLTGDLKLILEEAGTVYVSGALAYTPVIACARCALGIPWPLKMKIGVRFLPTGVNALPKEKLLTEAELDAYYLDNDQVDVEALVNDAVQTGLPMRAMVTTDDGSACRICADDLTETLVYGAKEAAEAPSPFAALSKLKLPN